jgi:hypothetical protein
VIEQIDDQLFLQIGTHLAGQIWDQIDDQLLLQINEELRNE